MMGYADIQHELYDTFYPVGTKARVILERHSRSVASLALEINHRRGLSLDERQVEAAAMLHDIGIFLCDAPSIGCFGSCPYMWHGILGADLLRRYGVEEHIALVAERHTGAGITQAQVAAMNLPRGAIGRVLMPETPLERLVCYADKFYSKSGDMQIKPLDRVRASIARFGADSLERFNALHREFGDS
ncbi:MAG: HD domain-containing protein [Odoribacter sp.]|nr:HD domain-containing protein [Odoribacter sp.]